MYISIDKTLQQLSFKPCYKWNTFNTVVEMGLRMKAVSFKPCYKWNTFNTLGGKIMKKYELLF